MHAILPLLGRTILLLGYSVAACHSGMILLQADCCCNAVLILFSDVPGICKVPVAANVSEAGAAVV